MFWYLATPYSKYPAGIDAAFDAACKAAGTFISAGIPVLSPIAHNHPIAVKADLDPHTHAIWLPADAPIMAAAHGCVVVRMPGWEESYGIQQETKAFRAAGKRVIGVDFPVTEADVAWVRENSPWLSKGAAA